MHLPKPLVCACRGSERLQQRRRVQTLQGLLRSARLLLSRHGVLSRQLQPRSSSSSSKLHRVHTRALMVSETALLSLHSRWAHI